MSKFSIVLVILNTIVVIPLLVLASGSVRGRLNYAQVMDNMAKQRDGIQTDELLKGLSAEGRQEVTKVLKSNYGQRRAVGDNLFEPLKGEPLSSQAQALLTKLGPEDYKQLLQKQIKLEQPKLADEERELTERKILLLTLKARYEGQQADMEAKIARLQADVTEEADLQRRMKVENDERKRELARLYAELEEALAARNVSQGNLRNAQEYLTRAVEQGTQLAEKNQTLAGQIQGQEVGR